MGSNEFETAKSINVSLVGESGRQCEMNVSSLPGPDTNKSRYEGSDESAIEKLADQLRVENHLDYLEDVSGGDSDDSNDTYESDSGSDSDSEEDYEDEDYDPDLARIFNEDDNEEGIEDEELDVNSESFRESLKAAAGMNVKQKKNNSRRRFLHSAKKIDPEVRMKLSKANEAFVDNNLEHAQKLYMDVISSDPQNFAALKTLGEISKMKGDMSTCCTYWLLAAQTNSSDSEFWVTVAELSFSLGYKRQGFYCYTQAVAHDTKDHKYYRERAELYLEHGEMARALTSFRNLVSLVPTDPHILIRLAKLYSLSNRISDAIEVFTDVLSKNIEFFDDPHNNGKTPEEFPIFRWSQLNILIELYFKSANFEEGLPVLIRTSRWLQGRADEIFWDDQEDDIEFDSRRFHNELFRELPIEKQQRTHDIPIDIRIKLGVLRLNLGYKGEALNHFGYLFKEEDIEDVGDLYLQVGKLLEHECLFEEAIKYLLPLTYSDSFANNELYSSTGKCYQETENYENASEFYRLVLESEPDNLDVKLALAECLYYCNSLQDSEKLVNEITSKSNNLDIKKSRFTSQVDSAPIDDAKINKEADLALLANIEKKSIRQSKKALSTGDMKTLARKLITDSTIKYNRLSKLLPAIEEKNDTTAVKMWVEIASDLIGSFMGVRSLFTKDKSKSFELVAIYVSKIKRRMNVDRRLEKLATLHELSNSNFSQINPGFTLTDHSYRGLTFDHWFDIFMRYSLFLASYGGSGDALETIQICKQITPFMKDSSKVRIMKLVKLSVDHITGDYEDVLFSIRDILNQYKYSRNALKLFGLILPSSRKAHEVFISLNNQKYFMRQVKAWDLVVFEGAKKSTLGFEDSIDVSSLHPYLTTIYSQILLCGKSYFAALFFLEKLYTQFKYDPMICLLLGIGYAHRAMQRLSANRHSQVLQALTYFEEYKKLRSEIGIHEAQEATYNIGRFFHQLDLLPIAIKYYNSVLMDYCQIEPTYSLKSEAAHNLYLIYYTSGNHLLAQSIIEKYLTI